jgi:hypothetical protein
MAGCTDAESLLMWFSDGYSAESKRSAIANQVRLGQMDNGLIYNGGEQCRGAAKETETCESSLSSFFAGNEIANKMNAGNLSLSLLGINNPTEEVTSFFALLFCFYHNALTGTRLTLLDGLQQSRTGRNNICY